MAVRGPPALGSNEDALAEDKDQNGQGKADGEGGRRGLPAAVLVLVGAMAGGAGVVLLSPAPAPHPLEERQREMRVFDHPDPMVFVFNPMSDRGTRTAQVHFLFSYRAAVEDVEMPEEAGGGEGGGDVALDNLPPVPHAIKLNWNRAVSRCIEVLSSKRVEVLLDPEGKKMLKRELIEELSATLFPDGIARVDDILWTKYLVN